MIRRIVSFFKDLFKGFSPTSGWEYPDPPTETYEEDESAGPPAQ